MAIRFARIALMLLCMQGIAAAQETPPPPTPTPPPLPPPVTAPPLPPPVTAPPDSAVSETVETETVAPVSVEPESAESLVNEDPRLALRGGVFWGTLDGSEVENADPALGFEIGAAYRMFGPLSLWGGLATSTHNVEGQVLQLLDQFVRPDRRSGTVSGEISSRRFRGGIRLDALRKSGTRVVPYFAAGVLLSTTEVKIDTVDGLPPQPVPNPGGDVVNVASYDESAIGGIARVGAEWRFSGALAVDGHLTYEILEFPTGTAAGVAAGGGVTYRL